VITCLTAPRMSMAMDRQPKRRHVQFQALLPDEDPDAGPARHRDRGTIIPEDSDSDPEDAAKRRRKEAAQSDAAPTDPGEMDEEDLKVFVARQKSAAAERILFGAAAVPSEEQIAADDVTRYEKEMGYTIEPFNTEEERRTGRYDAAGFWVKGAAAEEEDEVSDPWLAEVDAAADGGRPVARRAPAAAPDASETAPDEAPTYYETMLRLMHPGETLPNAIRRLKPVVKKPKPKRKPTASSSSASTSSNSKEAPQAPNPEAEEPADPAAFNALLEAAHALLDAGVSEIYDRTYEDLQRRLAELRPTPLPTAPTPIPETGPKWELRWSQEPDAEVHGPFPGVTMQGWKEHGFFSAERAAYTRMHNDDMFALEESDWQEAHTVDFVTTTELVTAT